MATPKKKKGKKKKSSSRGSKGFMGINFMELLGIGGGSFADKKGLDPLLDSWNLDPKLKAGAKIFLGGWLPKQSFVTGLIKDQNITQGAGSALKVHGVDSLMEEFNIAGVGDDAEEKELAIVIDGIDDVGTDDDIDVVNEDILGEDDIDVVNEDILGEDDDDDYN